MNSKAFTLSIAMAAIAFFFVSSYVTSIEDEAKKKFGTEILVVTAKRDIKEMETVTELMLEPMPIPKSFVEPAAITCERKKGGDSELGDKERKDCMKQIVGTVAIVPIKRKEQISSNKVTEPNMRTGLAPQVTPGRRAVSIAVNETTSVSKLVKPGDRVDLIVVVGPKDSRVAKTIMQDIVVLATGRAVSGNVARVLEADPYGGKEKVRNLAEDASYATVTVEVEPAQAQSLALVASNPDSPIWLSLRNNDDQDRVNTAPSTAFEVLGQTARTPAGGR